MSKLSEEDIIKRVVDGNIDLFGDLIEKYQERIFRYIYSQIRNYDDAKEITQDVFIAALEALPKFRGESKLSTWLFSIASNQSKTHIKKNSRVTKLPISMSSGDGSEYEMPLEDIRENIEHVVINNDAFEMAYDELLKMPEDYRNILILRDIEEMSYDEISRALSISMSNVKVRIHRGREMLKKRLVSRGLV